MDDFTPLLEYIETHIENKLDLKELSNFMGYSPYYLSRKFMSDFGMPLTGYVRIRKLQYSIKDLLADMKVIDVAMKYSFESHEGFTRSFQKLFGSSPKVIKNYLQDYSVPEVGIPAITKTISQENTKMSLVDDMHKMIYTILGNSFEELSAGFCSKIELRLLSDNTISIFDDGRGIKLDDGGEVHEEVLQNLFSGKPITKVEYARMGDLPLDELKLVNSLSESLQITVWRNGNIYRQDYVRGVPQHALTAKTNDSEIEHGTQIILKPDSVIFEDPVFSKEKLQSWVKDNYQELADKITITPAC
ncbi:MAG: helix-turn-helix domain-containing protein [Spirochaetaceae bacterium]|nr:helix-turn-helix domain-containing protein [Spirochaetaceae bacterium]